MTIWWFWASTRRWNITTATQRPNPCSAFPNPMRSIWKWKETPSPSSKWPTSFTPTSGTRWATASRANDKDSWTLDRISPTRVRGVEFGGVIIHHRTMFKRIQTRSFRCLKSVDQTLGPFRALVGPNASGKTTFLDVFGLLGDLIKNRGDVLRAIQERSTDFEKLLWMGQGRS